MKGRRIFQTLHLFLFLFVLPGCSNSVRQDEKSKNTDNNVQKTIVERQALLQTINQVAILLSGKNYERKSFLELFDSLGKKYFIEVADTAGESDAKDALAIYIGLYGNSSDRYDEIDFILPEKLGEELSFNDLKKYFGQWERLPDNFPHPKEALPVSFIVFRNKPDSIPVTIEVTGEYPPERTPNKIRRIDVIQTNKKHF